MARERVRKRAADRDLRARRGRHEAHELLDDARIDVRLDGVPGREVGEQPRLADGVVAIVTATTTSAST
jgi:hypothetical protein